jgi:multiple sugar transport system ATP-binding protein
VSSITFDHVDKRYLDGDRPALQDLELDIADGEFLVLVGPSGCGKTTALRCLAGLEDISGGHLRIGDRVVDDLPPRGRDLAMVFQSYALYPHLSVFENMAFSLRLRRAPRAEIEQRVREAAQMLDLEALLERKPGRLSGGQRQRVALGRAIVRQPAAFLMDEPLSNLDAKLRVQTRAQIARLHRRLETTILYVTHDQVEAMTMGDRIAVMEDGVLHQVGSPRELYQRPVDRFVAGFIGSPAMNLLRGTVASDGDGVVLRVGEVDVPLDGRAAAIARDRGRGTDLVVGVRPEHLEAGRRGTPGLRLQAVVDVVEFLGDDELVHATAAGMDLVAVVEAGGSLRPGVPMELTAADRNVHVFDATTGVRLEAS